MSQTDSKCWLVWLKSQNFVGISTCGKYDPKSIMNHLFSVANSQNLMYFIEILKKKNVSWNDLYRLTFVVVKQMVLGFQNYHDLCIIMIVIVIILTFCNCVNKNVCIVIGTCMISCILNCHVWLGSQKVVGIDLQEYPISFRYNINLIFIC